MKVLAILQNQWFRDPARVRPLMEGPNRRRYIEAFLFAGCLSGRRLRLVFGDYEGIVWEESSRHVGGHSGACFPPDPYHLRDVIADVQPDVVLAFGKIAERGVRMVWQGPTIIGPHPAARINAVAGLRRMERELRCLMNGE